MRKPHAEQQPNDAAPETNSRTSESSRRKANGTAPAEPGIDNDGEKPNTGAPESEDDKPKPAATLKNVVRLLENEPFRGRLWYDDFLRRLMTSDPAREWTDADDLELTITIQTQRGFSRCKVEAVRQAALVVAFRHPKNCVTDWLKTLIWDGIERIAHFFPDHFGAMKNAYSMAVGRNFWISLVARAFKPGCQADHMTVLEGEQGINKSSALRAIGGQWFTEQHEAVTSRGFFENLQGKLLVEISEMDSFSRAETTKVKQVVTNTSDRFRESYGRHSKDHPRQCVFVGTTNRDDWNKDETGARRFWPIRCQGEIDLNAIRNQRTQLFAEAVHRFRAGESWWEMPNTETATEQAKRYVPPAWVEPIQKYLEYEPIRDDDGSVRWVSRPRPRFELTIAEVFEHALDMPESQWTKANEMRVAESLRYLRWEKDDAWKNGKKIRRWIAPNLCDFAEV